MTRRAVTPLVIAALVAAAGPASAETPSAKAIIDLAVEAAEIDSTLATQDVMRAAIRQEETTSDGNSTTRDLTAIFHGANLDNVRLELGGGVSLVLNGATGWATIRGELDSRAQAERIAPGTLRQTLFPLLFPFSLRLEGVQLGAVTEESFDSTPVWAVEAGFAPGFFAAPTMSTTWKIFISRQDHLVLGAEFLPPEEFRQARGEGVRYRILKREVVDGIQLPTQVLLDGIDFNGMENGHVRVTKLAFSTVGPFDPAVFMHPDALAKLDAGDVE
jgi:hypothetical protein